MKLHICVYLHTKFPVSSVILTTFRQDDKGLFTFPPPINECLKIPPRLELMISSPIIFDVVILQFYLHFSKSGIWKTSDELKPAMKKWTEETIVWFIEKTLIVNLDKFEAWFSKILIIALNSLITLREKERRY